MSRHSLGPPGERLSLDGVVGGSGCRCAWPSVARQKSRGCCHASIYAHHTTPAPGTGTSGMKPPPRLTHETLGGGFLRNKTVYARKTAPWPGGGAVCVCLRSESDAFRKSHRKNDCPCGKSKLRTWWGFDQQAFTIRKGEEDILRLVHAVSATSRAAHQSTHAHAPLRTMPQSASCPLARLHSTSGLFRHSFGYASGTPRSLQTLEGACSPWTA